MADGTTMDLEPFVNKTVSLRFRGADLSLDLSHALFSSFDIDQGTKLLLKLAGRDEALGSARRILDEGCGTGVIGLAVAKALPAACVTLRDRDLLAVAFARRNRASNRLRGRTQPDGSGGGESGTAPRPPVCVPGLLADGLEGGPYDYILSNLPAKAGLPVLEAFFASCAGVPAGLPHRGPLAPGGTLAVVVVNTLADRILACAAGHGLAIRHTERGAMHTAFLASRGEGLPEGAGIAESGVSVPARTGMEEIPSQAGIDALAGIDVPEGGTGAATAAGSAPPIVSAPPGSRSLVLPDLLRLGPYLRCESRLKIGTFVFRARGFWGLGDFDTPNRAVVLAAETIAKAAAGSLVRHCTIVNPGVGHIAIWVAGTFGPASIHVAGRDILSLAATAENLRYALTRPPAFSADCAYARESDAGPDGSGSGTPGGFAGGDGGTGTNQAGTRPDTDLLILFPDIVPRTDWTGSAWTEARRMCKKGAHFAVSSAPAETVRLEKRRPPGWRLVISRRRSGFESLVYRRED